jgi:hypothetical protein
LELEAAEDNAGVSLDHLEELKSVQNEMAHARGKLKAKEALFEDLEAQNKKISD